MNPSIPSVTMSPVTMTAAEPFSPHTWDTHFRFLTGRSVTRRELTEDAPLLDQRCGASFDHGPAAISAGFRPADATDRAQPAFPGES